jgi:hypothetical protein
MGAMQRIREKTAAIFDILFLRLSERGLTPVEIVRLIKDVFNVVRDGGDFTTACVNQRLENLGWSRETMDESSFQLILCLFESECSYDVRKNILH